MMIIREPIDLVGERARLVALEDVHTQALFTAGRFSEIWSYMPTKVTSLAEMEAVAGHALDAKRSGSEFPFVIIDQVTDTIVGSTRFLDISVSNCHLEIGWTWLTPAVWRTRINTECKYLLLKYCFETLKTVRVQLKTDGRNTRSQQAIERIGATREGVLRKHRILSDGYIRDSVYYSVIDDEWPSVKSRLEMMLRR